MISAWVVRTRFGDTGYASFTRAERVANALVKSGEPAMVIYMQWESNEVGMMA